MNIEEIWKPVRGYEDSYEVSNLGRVRTLNWDKTGQVRVMKPRKCNGYERICIYKSGIKKDYFIHRLTWEAFVGPIPEGKELDHINTIRDDNRLENLRCVTRKDNHDNPISKQRHLEAVRKLAKDPEWLNKTRNNIRRRCNKPIFQIDLNTGEVIREWECMSDAERAIGVSNTVISRCCRGKQKHAGGFLWRYAENNNPGNLSENCQD